MRRIFVLLLALVSLTKPAFSAGLIIIHESDFWREPMPRIVPPPRTPPPVWTPLELAFTKADVAIKDQLATTVVEQEFYNPNARQLEGTFLFPVPKGAHINKFTMEINGKPVDAELLTAEKARGIYEDIVRRLRDPALLEYSGRDVFKVRIFPIEPNARKRITLSYSQLLKNDGGLVAFTYPLNTERYSATPLKNVSLKIDIESKQSLKSIYSPSHKVEIRRHGDRKATVGYEATNVKPDSDFQLYFAPEKDELGVNLLTYRNADGDGYFLLLASPGIDAKAEKILPKDVCFVLDTSGSMAGPKLEQARKALAFCVENLNSADRFEVLRFSTEVDALFNRLVDASRDNQKRAQDYIRDLKPTGGTAIDDALKKALALRPQEGQRPYVVIFLTDGRPTVGTTEEEKIVAGVKEGSRGNVRVFCFGIGTDVNTHLLDKITEETRAYSQYVLPEEDIEVKVSGFFTKVKDPVLANPTVNFPGSVRVSRLYPSPVPDVFKGEQIVLAGRYSGHGDGAIEVEGLVNGEKRRFAYDVKFPEKSEDHEFIPRLWATRRVGYLLDEIRLRGESGELKDEVVQLARQYNIVTPYTAYLIVEDEGRRGVAVTRRFYGERAPEARSGLVDSYNRLKDEKNGDAAVGGARSLSVLKQAEAPAPATAAAGFEAARGELKLARQFPGSATPAMSGPADESRKQFLTNSSQFVAGKTFFYNENKWIDSDLQKVDDRKLTRIQFGSPEYFDLLAKNPTVVKWLAMGRNVQFVLNGVAYEVYE
jgi:Ca-activated chloride channel family protein